jgi:hypothetical protein
MDNTDFYITNFSDMLNHRHDIKAFLYVPAGDSILAKLTFQNAGVKAKWDEVCPILDKQDPRVVQAIIDYPAMGQ